MNNFFIDKISIKITKLAKRMPDIFFYLLKRLLGTASQEPELSFLQKIRSSYILPGMKHVTFPSGCFKGPKKKLKILDDLQGLPNALWINHAETRIPLPKNGADSRIIKTIWKSPAASFILTVKGGHIAPNGLVFDNDHIYRNAKWYYEPPPDSLPVIEMNKVITFIQLWSDTFVHFTFDTLPRINLAYDFICQDPEIKILIPDQVFFARAIEELGIDPGRVVRQKADTVYSADIVYYPHFYNYGKPQKMGLIPRSSLEKVRRKLAGRHISNLQNLIVYLKRKKGSTRCVINEEEIIDGIKRRLKAQLTLKVFEPKNDWIQDREVFKCARVVIGPHGGAFSNLIFCKENTDVIEFLPLISLKQKGDNERPCYYGLSNALGLNYWTIEPKNFNFEKPDMFVPVNKLLSILHSTGVLVD